jgi:excisionase family DNA binding protein
MSIDGRRTSATTEWMSIHEAASLMGVSPATLRRWSDAGDIRTFTTPGGHRRFSRSAIAGLLPSEVPPAPSEDQLAGTRSRMIRAVRRASRRVAHDAPWGHRLAESDRAMFAALGRQMIEAVVVVMDGNEPEERSRQLDRSRIAAAECGALAAQRAVSLRQTVETCLRLRALVIRELTIAGRRHDMDGAATTRWLETSTREIDRLVMEVMRGHEAEAPCATSAFSPGPQPATGGAGA